jgi:hypothetical protein
MTSSLVTAPTEPRPASHRRGIPPSTTGWRRPEPTLPPADPTLLQQVHLRRQQATMMQDLLSPVFDVSRRHRTALQESLRQGEGEEGETAG